MTFPSLGHSPHRHGGSDITGQAVRALECCLEIPLWVLQGAKVVKGDPGFSDVDDLSE